MLPLWVAEMDFPLAEPVARALTEAVSRSDTGYRWDDDLPAVFAEWTSRTQGWPVDPDRVTIVGDVLTGVAAALRAWTDEGTGVVVTPPVYPPFFSTIAEVTGRRVVEVPLVPDGHHLVLDLDHLAAAFARPDVSAFLLCSPHNPTGAVLTAAELTAVAELATRYAVTVVADEVHGPLTLPGAAFVPYLSLGEDLTGTAVTITSASKTWNVPGLKCAQVVTGSAARQRELLRRLPMEVRMSAGHLGVLAAEAAFRDGGPWRDRVVATLDRNRGLVGDLLAAAAAGGLVRPSRGDLPGVAGLPGPGAGPGPGRGVPGTRPGGAVQWSHLRRRRVRLRPPQPGHLPTVLVEAVSRMADAVR